MHFGTELLDAFFGNRMLYSFMYGEPADEGAFYRIVNRYQPDTLNGCGLMPRSQIALAAGLCPFLVRKSNFFFWNDVDSGDLPRYVAPSFFAGKIGFREQIAFLTRDLVIVMHEGFRSLMKNRDERITIRADGLNYAYSAQTGERLVIAYLTPDPFPLPIMQA